MDLLITLTQATELVRESIQSMKRAQVFHVNFKKTMLMKSFTILNLKQIKVVKKIETHVKHKYFSVYLYVG